MYGIIGKLDLSIFMHSLNFQSIPIQTGYEGSKQVCIYPDKQNVCPSYPFYSFFIAHKNLTANAKPCHDFCLVDWCPYKQAEAAGTLQTFKHSNNLQEAVMEEMRPICKCLRDYTQNANERINNLIWKFCPKTKHHGKTTAETAVALAECIYNDGYGRLITHNL